MDFKSFLSDNIVILDGGMGTLLQGCGLSVGEYPESLNISRPELIENIHKAYYGAGANVVSTNTFGANSFKFSDGELEEIISAAVENAKRARSASPAEREKFIALDIGPSGKLLKPLGTLDFEDAVEAFSKTVRIGLKYGVDLIILETFNDSYETKAALLAVKENSDLPVIVTNAYGTDGKLMTGASPEAMAALLEGMGADAIGANCSFGPDLMADVARRLLDVSSVPVVMKPNAGLPKLLGDVTVYDVNEKEFADTMRASALEGVRVLGGCCGTTPEYISALAGAVSGLSAKPITPKNLTVISSYTNALEFGKAPVLIGERINPTGKKRFKEALLAKDFDYILGEAVRQEEKGVHALDVNVGLPEIDETDMLTQTVRELQAVTALPLQIDSSNPETMESALRAYNGKAMINSVNGKRESMEKIFPLMKKYGGVAVALTLDGNGIPETAEGRFEIAKRIIDCAKSYGIDKKDLIFDTLTMAVSADKNAALVTLEALRMIKERLGAHTVLGVSNVSFGLPMRDAVNSVFFVKALSMGLSAAIMNPHSSEMMKAYYANNALSGLDEGFSAYISEAENFASPIAPVSNKIAESTDAYSKDKFTSELRYAIVKGLFERARTETKELLSLKQPLDIVSEEIIPALSYVGERFEKGEMYLPQLLMSAESAKAAFSVIKDRLRGAGDNSSENGIPFVLATVKGDIHDIGKNIVKLLLENYGYNVIDLGKDVAPEAVLEAVEKHSAPLLGLSALMTTTTPAMKETVALVKREAPDCKIIVGGAVLTAEYAEKIGADAYASDAMETVRLAKALLE